MTAKVADVEADDLRYATCFGERGMSNLVREVCLFW
jgi:hypothetical protein